MNYYVYILRLGNGAHYVRSTPDVKNRLQEHKSGYCLSTKNKLPCELAWYCRFSSKSRALKFEKYLKSGSGRAFRHKRLE